MKDAFHLTIDSEGFARLVFDFPDEKINKISIELMQQLDKILDDLAKNSAVRALILTSAKEGIFIAGADLKSFEHFFKEPELAKEMIQKGHHLLNKLENLPFISVAVINGACLGGGMELALACTFRVVGDSEKTSLGLPETNLGLYPGWGGTQRMPRLVGFTQGLTMIVSGKPVDAKKAYKIHLADAIFAEEFLSEKTDQFVEKCLSVQGRKEILQRRKKGGIYNTFFDKNPLGRALVAWQVRKKVLKKTKGFYPSPLAAIDVVKNTYSLPLKKGLEEEIVQFSKSIDNGDFRYVNNLIQLFFNREAIKKDPGLPPSDVAAPTIHRAAVLGAGTMGSGISWLLSYRDIAVRMKDIDFNAIAKGLQNSYQIYQTLIKLKKVTPSQATAKMLKIAGVVDYSGFQQLDIVIEAAVEDFALKQKIFHEVEERISSSTIVATNTSSFTIEELSKEMQHPERFVGMHFFNPPSRMPLVEVVASEKTSPVCVHAAVQLCQKLKKTAIVVKDCTGFLVNRIFVRAFFEILSLLEDGAPMSRIDALFLKFGFPLAPFVLADEVGNDVNLKVFQNLAKAYSDRISVPEILVTMVERNLLGKKTKKGFYIHKSKKPTPNPEIEELLKNRSKKTNLKDEEIIDRLTLAMINEASRCLEEEIVKKAAFVDIALVYGMGFPPFRGGLLKYADSLGIDQVVTKMKQFYKELGERYRPTEQLKEMQKNNRAFYEGF